MIFTAGMFDISVEFSTGETCREETDGPVIPARGCAPAPLTIGRHKLIVDEGMEAILYVLNSASAHLFIFFLNSFLRVE